MQAMKASLEININEENVVQYYEELKRRRIGGSGDSAAAYVNAKLGLTVKAGALGAPAGRGRVACRAQ